MSHFIIDQQGTIWELGDAQRAGRLPSWLDGPALLRDLVCRQGLVIVEVKPAALRIRLRASIVEQRTMAGLLYFLFDTPAVRIVISEFVDDWQDTLYGSQRAAAQRLMSISLERNNPRASDFLRRTAPWSQLSRHEQMARLLAKWRETGALSPRRAPMRLLLREWRNRSVLVSVCGDPAHPHFTYQVLGEDIELFDEGWRESVIGSRVDSMPDYAYGKWSSTAYAEVARSGEPKFEDLDVIVRAPGAAPVRTTYQRILLPVKDAFGPDLVLGLTLRDLAVNLRGDASQGNATAVKRLLPNRSRQRRHGGGKSSQGATEA